MGSRSSVPSDFVSARLISTNSSASARSRSSHRAASHLLLRPPRSRVSGIVSRRRRAAPKHAATTCRNSYYQDSRSTGRRLLQLNMIPLLGYLYLASPSGAGSSVRIPSGRWSSPRPGSTGRHPWVVQYCNSSRFYSIHGRGRQRSRLRECDTRRGGGAARYGGACAELRH